jgi:hypothetical protein
MKKYLFLNIIGLIWHFNMLGQTGQPIAIGIGTDTLAPMITIGQPYCENSFGFASLVNNSVDSLLSYNMGEIPDITVTPGIKTRFKITWEDHGDAVYTCSEIDYPYEILSISIIPSDNGVVFEYTPTDDVFENFKLAFRATQLNESVEQTVTFNPVQALPQEYKTIAYACNSFLMDTIVVNKSVGNDTVYIIGTTVVFEDGEINSGAYHYKGTSVEKLAIYATSVIVRDSVALPGCELTIYCENLSFGTENACFDIQPNDGLGTEGEDTKNMCVYAKNFVAPGYSYRFRLRGGQGASENTVTKTKAKGGGNAGNFTSNLNLRKYVNLEGGYTGNTIDSTTLGTKGKEGEYTPDPSLYRWLHPILVRFALGNVTNDYIHGLDNRVNATCEKYISILDAYKKSNEYDTSTLRSLDLMQLYNSFTNVQEKLLGGYDYFGNPKAWAPLLSFEANQTMYESEVDYAIRVLYLHYWITGKASKMKDKKSAAGELIEKNTKKVSELQRLYEKARIDYSPQKDKFLEDSKELYELDKLLNEKLDSLYARAEKIIANKNKWRGIVFTVGDVCSCIPSMNHYGIVMKGIAQLDYNDPFSSENLDVAFESCSLYIDDMISKTEIVAGIYLNKPDLVADGSKELIMESLGNISPEQQKKNQDLKRQIVMPKDEVDAKFNQLKATCPQIDDLADSMQIVNDNKAKSWEDLSYTLNILNNTSDEINRLIASNNALNDILNNNTYDPRAISVLNEMEKNAWATLLKYHYYLARAYQYRFLEPYNGSINMQDFFEKIETIATKDSVKLSSHDFDALKIIFEAPLKEITDGLYTRINRAEYAGTNAPGSYTLSSEDLNTLNSKGEVTINLWESGILPKYYADARLTDFQLSSTDIDVWADTLLTGAKLKVLLQHSGKSMFINHENGMHCMFDQYNSEAGKMTNSLSPIGWGFSYDFNDKEVTKLTRSVSSQSLIKHMLGDNYSDNHILIYSLPSAWADITIRRVVDIGTSEVTLNSTIKKLELQFNVDYEDIGKKNLANIVVKTNNGLTPVIQCNKADVNGLTHGRGSFTRTYPAGKSIEITAPENYGNYAFSRWLLTTGGTVRPITDNTINVSASESRLLTLEYKLAVPQIKVPDTIWVDHKAQSVPFNVKNSNYCNDITMDWSITENCDWLSIAGGSQEGTENGTVTLQLLENKGVRRTSRINICSPNAINPYVDIVVVQTSKTTDVNVVLKEAGHPIKLMPNPASSMLNVAVEGICSGQQLLYSIMDMQGKQLLCGSEFINAEHPEFNINIEQFSIGMYILLITTENKGVLKAKLMIDK